MNERTSCVYPIRVIRREALPATVALGKSKFGAMAMGKIKLLLGASILLLVSVQVNASPVTVGSLSSDDDGSTQIITDTYNNFEWLRWDVLADLNYTQTLAAIGSSGAYQGWNIAGNAEAQLFVDALVGTGNACDIFAANEVSCSNTPTTAYVFSSLVGDNFIRDSGTFSNNEAFFLSDNGVGQEVGYVQLAEVFENKTSYVNKMNEWSTIVNSDSWSATGSAPLTVNWLLYRDLPEIVTIDIKPNSDPNSINPKSNGVIPVAVLGSTDFDATQVDVLTVTFGLGGASSAHDGHVEDVNDDGFMDMMFHFKTQETGIVCGDTEATLTGETFEDTQFTGTDTIKTVGCNGNSSEKVDATSIEGAGAMSWMLLLGLSVLGLWRQNGRQ